MPLRIQLPAAACTQSHAMLRHAFLRPPLHPTSYSRRQAPISIVPLMATSPTASPVAAPSPSAETLTTAIPKPKLKRDSESIEETIYQLTEIVGTKLDGEPISPATYCRTYEQCGCNISGKELCNVIQALRSYRATLERKMQMIQLAAGMTAPPRFV